MPTQKLDPGSLTIRYAGLCAYVSLLSILCLLTSVLGCGGGSPRVENPGLAAPVITAISPSVVPAGSADFTLTVTGSGFLAGSIVRENGALLSTSFVSANQLTATVTASVAASGGNLAISVVNPDGQSSTGGTGNSGDIALAVNTGTPIITSLAPDSVTAGSAATDVVVTGTNFVPASTASFGGSPRPTQVRNGTQLAVSLSAADLAAPAITAIMVTNPSPGGGTSAAAPFKTISSDAPTLTGLSPAAVIVGSPQVTLTLSGTNFVPSSQVFVNNFFEPTQYLSSSTLTTTLAPNYFYDPGAVLQVVVINPIGGPSNPLIVPIVNPVPTLTSISPAKVAAGAPDFLLQLTGASFIQGAQALVNGTPREVFSATPSSLLVRISAADVAAVGSVDVSMQNPAPGGGASGTIKLQILPASNRLRTVHVAANDLAWDPKQNRIYAAVKASSAEHSNSIVAIDPESGAVIASQSLASEPGQLSLTSDQQYLYVSLPSANAVARLALPGLVPDLQWTLGTDSGGLAYHALDLQAAPGQPHTIAVTRAVYTSGDSGGIVIYDDGQPRPKIAVETKDFGAMYRYIQWNSIGMELYASGVGTTTGNHQHTFAVSSAGLDLIKDAGNVGLVRFFFDPATARFYNGASAIDASTDKLLGFFSLPHARNSLGGFAVDSKNHRLYDLVYSYPLGFNEYGTEIQVFDLDRYTPIDSLFVNGESSGEASLIRWGAAGLALAGDQIYLLDGPFVTPGAVPSAETGSYAVPAPVLNSISPEAVPAGSGTTNITVRGKDFAETTTVAWNGNQVASTLVSPTEMQITLPMASLTNPVAGPIIASNGPGTGGSNALAFTVLPDLGPDLQLSTINLSGTDLVWNAAENVFYVGVTDADPVNGNSIVTVDAASTTVKAALSLVSQPGVLAISDDDRYLYAGLAHNAVVQRYGLPAMTPDLSVPLGVGGNASQGPPGASENCDFAVGLKVAPGAAGTIAVAQGSYTTEQSGCGPLAVFDDGVPRPQTAPGYISLFDTYHDFSSIAWAGNQTSIYAQTSVAIDFQDLYALSVSPAGVTFDKNFLTTPGLGYDLHFDPGTGYLYSDGGRVTNPADGSAVGYFPASGLMVPDSKLGRAFFLGRTSDQGFDAYTLQIYNIRNFKLIGSIVIPNVIGFPMRLVRWGGSGVAFVTCCGNDRSDNAPGQLYVLSGAAINGGGSSPSAGAASGQVQLSWNPRQGRSRSKDETRSRR